MPGGPLNLNSTNLPRPRSPRKSSPSGKIPTVEQGFFLNLSAFIPVSIYNNYIVLLYQPTSTSKGSLAERTAMCVIFETRFKPIVEGYSYIPVTSGRTVLVS